MKTQRSADIAVGCFITLLGVFVLLAAMMITGGAAHRLPPRTFPVVVGLFLLFCGIGLTLKSWRFRGEDPIIKWPDKDGVRIILVVLISLGFYIALMNRLGLPLSTFLFVAFSSWYLKPARWGTALLVGLIAGVVTYTLFIRLLDLSFPAGFLFEG